MENVNKLEVKEICKSFGKNNVLKNVNFQLAKGEVHALIGENGAGKSTLLKILFGIHAPTQGEVEIDGKQVTIGSPSEAIKHGFAMIHQEPSVFTDLSVAENMYMGLMEKKTIDWKKIESTADAILRQLGLQFSPQKKMLHLSVAEQQLVEIGSALLSDANIIFMDEPTASLTSDEANNLLSIIKTFRNEGKSIIYISHRLDEIKEIADRITILRDGEIIGTYRNEEVSKEQMIQLMLGRTMMVSDSETSKIFDAKPFFEVKNISYRNAFRGISFAVSRGEVFGIYGLMGAGRTEVARALFGITPVDSGEIWVDGKPARIKTPRDAIQHGIALVPEDRQGLGIILQQSISLNTTFAIPSKITQKPFGWLDKKRETEISHALAQELKTKCTDVNQNAGDLSGGNQQKVSLAKWVATEPEILILDEPTRGIDVGAKAEFYKIIKKMAASGKCIIMISSELSEIIALSDRVMVMYEGNQTGILGKEDMTEMRILSAAHDHMGAHEYGCKEA